MRWCNLLSNRSWRLAIPAAAGILCCCVGGWVAVRAKPAQPRSGAKAPPKTSTHASGTVNFDLLAKLIADNRRGVSPNEWLRELADTSAPFRLGTQNHLLLDHPAPDFTLGDYRGQRWHLRTQLEKGPVVVVFYLAYYCSFCVHDLFQMNADLERFHTLGAEVVGISGDAPEVTCQRFERYGAFGFPTLTDPEHVVAEAYGVYRPEAENETDRLLHGTFIIARDGRVRWVRFGDAPLGNNKALLYEVARLRDKLPRREPPAGPEQLR